MFTEKTGLRGRKDTSGGTAESQVGEGRRYLPLPLKTSNPSRWNSWDKRIVHVHRCSRFLYLLSCGRFFVTFLCLARFPFLCYSRYVSRSCLFLCYAIYHVLVFPVSFSCVIRDIYQVLVYSCYSCSLSRSWLPCFLFLCYLRCLSRSCLFISLSCAIHDIYHVLISLSTVIPTCNPYYISELSQLFLYDVVAQNIQLTPDAFLFTNN